jgi:hypothetical protein
VGVQDVDRLLARLEALGAAEEAGVVRAALAAGVPLVVAVEELQREIARREARASGFYDEQRDWE